MSDLGKLYQQVILAHHKAPRHAAPLAAPTHVGSGTNPLCGDRASVTALISGGCVAEIGCEVKGCAICRASGSLMAEAVRGRELGEVLRLGQRFLAALGVSGDASPPGTPATSDVSEEELGALAPLLEAGRYPNRLRCATLPWEALRNAIAGGGP